MYFKNSSDENRNLQQTESAINLVPCICGIAWLESIWYVFWENEAHIAALVQNVEWLLAHVQPKRFWTQNRPSKRTDQKKKILSHSFVIPECALHYVSKWWSRKRTARENLFWLLIAKLVCYAYDLSPRKICILCQCFPFFECSPRLVFEKKRGHLLWK